MTASFNGPKRCPKCLTGIEFTTVPCAMWKGTMGYPAPQEYTYGDGTRTLVPAQPMLDILDHCYEAMARAKKVAA